MRPIADTADFIAVYPQEQLIQSKMGDQEQLPGFTKHQLIMMTSILLKQLLIHLVQNIQSTKAVFMLVVIPRAQFFPTNLDVD